MSGFKSLPAYTFVITLFFFSLISEKAIASDELSSPFFNGTGDGKWATTLFVGQLTENELAEIVFPQDVTFTSTTFVGAALSRELYRWKGFSIEAEGGLGYQFGGGSDESAGHVWGALYGRYDAFPWNHVVHTSVAGSIGLSYITQQTAFENSETNDGDTKQLLHYFSPEITFALPDHRDKELVLRLHHRSGANGAFGCDGCGSNIISFGFRKRF